MTDLRLAIRSLARAPIIVVAIILTIALGIGATTAVFSLVYGVLYRPLPYPDADRLVAVWQTRPRNPKATDQKADAFVSDSLLKSWRDNARCFDEIGGFTTQAFSVSAGGEVERVNGAAVQRNAFAGAPLRLESVRLPRAEDFTTLTPTMARDSAC